MNIEPIGKKHIALILLIYCGYIVYAFYYNGFGTNASAMMDFYQLTSARQGFIFTMQSVGGLFMSVFLALRGERYNKINVFTVGTLLVGATSLVVGFALPYAALILLVVASGAGYASMDVMANSLIPELYPKRKNTLLPVAHAFYGTGAMLAPLLVTALVNPDAPSSFARPFLLIGALGLVLLPVLWIVGRRVIPETPYAHMDAVQKRVSDNPAEIFKTKKAWMFLLAGILYFSFQIGIISWLPTYCKDIGLDFAASGAMLTAFFIGSLVMRFCGPLILRLLTARKAYILFGLLSVAASTAALLLTQPAAMMILFAMCGFMQGSCVAFLVLMSTEAFPQRVASASSIPFIAANAAAMTAPLWMGGVAEYTGFRIPLLLVGALMVVSVRLVQQVGKQEPAATRC